MQTQEHDLSGKPSNHEGKTIGKFDLQHSILKIMNHKFFQYDISIFGENTNGILSHFKWINKFWTTRNFHTAKLEKSNSAETLLQPLATIQTT